MRSIIKGILFTVLLGFFTVVAAHQLPPEGDRLLSGLLSEWFWAPILATLSAIWAAYGDLIVPSKRIRKFIMVVLSAGTVGSGFNYVEERVYVSEHTISKTIKDSVKVTVIDTMALEGIQEAIVLSIQAREGQLDSTIKTLQDSVRALQDSVNKHPDRHLHIIEAKLDALRDLYEQ